MSEKKRIAIIGGGAAGFFAAITCAENSSHEVIILESKPVPLAKVKISGGGRCNLSFNCFDPRELVSFYPRGAKELRSVFSRFQPADTLEWFSDRGVALKTEDDGRIFPETDESATVVNCFLKAAAAAGVKVRFSDKAKDIVKSSSGFDLIFKDNHVENFDKVLIATGGRRDGGVSLSSLGHEYTDCIPSLFSFNSEDAALVKLAGLSVQKVSLQIELDNKNFTESGPVLITHSGISGPAVIRLSALAAPELAKVEYKTEVRISWVEESVLPSFQKQRAEAGKRCVHNTPLFDIPKRFWEFLVERANILKDRTWASLNRGDMDHLEKELTDFSFQISRRGAYKDEFVTCGGVNRKEINFKTMESRIVPGLYFAGEVIDIDALTGGFNLQNAWSTGFIAGMSLAE